MKYLLVFFTFFVLGCTTVKYPDIYPDLYESKLITTNYETINLFHHKRKDFWVYSFKAIATLSYQGKENENFKIERNYIKNKFEKIADSLGKSSVNNFYNYIHFHDSKYLNDKAILYYELSKSSLTKEEREIIKNSRKEEH